jgi:hypothetical protein
MRYLFFSVLLLVAMKINAQGTWAPLKNKTPYSKGGCMVMLLMTDGTIMIKTDSVPNDTIGSSTWSLLTPDVHGSYLNGTWTNLSSMSKNRLYFSSQVLQDGRVLVIGGENGDGQGTAEIYDPVKNTWTLLFPIGTYWDGNSELLPDGRVLVAKLEPGAFFQTRIYNPFSNTWANGPTCHGSSDESAWVKLPDNSIIYVDIASRKSERYIPALNKWLVEDTVPVSIYDPYGDESGPAFLLPDGRAFFIGSMPVTAFYTPSGDTTKGKWLPGPVIPDSMGMPDASGAMMVNGKILLVFSHTPSAAHHFPRPSVFYEFNYLTNTFQQIVAPGGGDTLQDRTADCNMLDLPDGTVLYSNQGSSQLYVYTPDESPLAAGKPSINNITQNECTFTITGTLFNGISEGAVYGDDWQMPTNRPIIRLSADSNVYYVKTTHWNSTGLQRGIQADTATFTLPETVPYGDYTLVVTANGNASDTINFNYRPCLTGLEESKSPGNNLKAYPNPADNWLTIDYSSTNTGNYITRIIDVLGRTVMEQSDVAVMGINSRMLYLNGISPGIYLINVQQKDEVYSLKIIVR